MGSKAHVFACPKFFSPLYHFDWTVNPVNFRLRLIDKQSYAEELIYQLSQNIPKRSVFVWKVFNSVHTCKTCKNG